MFTISFSKHRDEKKENNLLTRCEILLIESKKELLNAILTKEMKNSNLFLLLTHYCKNFKTSFVYDFVSWSQIKIKVLKKTHASCSNTRKIAARSQVSRLATMSQQPSGCGRNSILFWNWSTCPPQPYLSAQTPLSASTLRHHEKSSLRSLQSLLHFFHACHNNVST